MKLISSLTFVLLLFSLSISSVHAYYTNMPAYLELGQTDFSGSSVNAGGVSSHSFNRPYAVHTDGTHFLVTDFTNHRVLLWNNIPTQMNEDADVVIGQPDFVSKTANQGGANPAANTIKYAGPTLIVGNKLLVSDFYNYRVLIYNTIPTTNNAFADVVIGQTDFTTNTSGCSDVKYGGPWMLEYDESSGKLIVADLMRHRILIYNSIPATNGVAADVVIGQTDMSTCTSGTSATKLYYPYSARVFDGKLIVSDSSNSRVLIYNSIPATNGVAADIVIGQPDFVSNADNQGGSVGQNTLLGPTDTWFDGRHFFIFDAYNSRILGYNGIPSTNNAQADFVIGQPNFTSNSGNQGLSAPTSQTLAGFNGSLYSEGSFSGLANKLFVVDVGNHRALFYEDILSTPQISLGSVTDSASYKKKISGSIHLGERGKYSLQSLQVNVNGQGYTNAMVDGGRDDGEGKTVYGFSFSFEPWAGMNKDQWLSDASFGFNVFLKAQSFNADSEELFYFEPFTLDSISGVVLPTFSFSVNKRQWARIKDTISSYEIETRKDGSTEWKTYLSGIPSSSATTNSSISVAYDEKHGKISVFSRKISLPSGKHEVRVVAVDKWGNRQTSNSLEFVSQGVSTLRPMMAVFSGWFPLQVNSITGVRSAFFSNFSLPPNEFISQTRSPRFDGIAFSGATVTMGVTNITTGEQKTYTALVTNSEWSITPQLYTSSLIDLWVISPEGKYTEIPPFKIGLMP